MASDNQIIQSRSVGMALALVGAAGVIGDLAQWSTWIHLAPNLFLIAIGVVLLGWAVIESRRQNCPPFEYVRDSLKSYSKCFAELRDKRDLVAAMDLHGRAFLFIEANLGPDWADRFEEFRPLDGQDLARFCDQCSLWLTRRATRLTKRTIRQPVRGIRSPQSHVSDASHS